MTPVADPQLQAHYSSEPPDAVRREAEARQQAIRRNLRALGRSGADLVRVIRHAAHSLTGSAGPVGSQTLTHLAERIEALLDRMNEGLAVAPDPGGLPAAAD